MSRLWLVRHGPTHAKSMVGWTDLPADLSDHAALARLNAHLPPAPVVSSDLIRAVATADALTGRPRLPHDPALREMHFGAWENRTWADVDSESPALIRAFWESPGAHRAPGGEGWDDLYARVTPRLAALAKAHDDLIVVAHFGPILTALQWALGLSVQAVFAQKIDNLSVTCLQMHPGPKALAINHIP